MPRFGEKSKAQLASAHPELQRLFNAVIEFYDCTILEGHRGEARQNQLYEDGKTTLRWPHSKHNVLPSRAVDVAPYPIDWGDRERFYFLAGVVKAYANALGIKVRWGGDWDSDDDLHDQRFDDLPHWELVE